eukprot:m.8287 g.8287  ORF g.8287 m.8287 type:complete len:294 (-) comp6698_c0_seq1:16-897(-)
MVLLMVSAWMTVFVAAIALAASNPENVVSSRVWNTWLLRDEPDPAGLLGIFQFNGIVWTIITVSAYALMYLEPGRSFAQPYKLNKRYPSTLLVVQEFLRSVRGVVIASIMEYALEQMYVAHSLPLQSVEVFEVASPTSDLTMTFRGLLANGVLLVFVGETHFYWAHRLLHTSWLYRNVHYVHHKSHNPDPLSGLSMHWFESVVYFSSAAVLALITPMASMKIMTVMLLVYPLEGHMGHFRSQNSIDHYIHHSKFNWNYGANPIWDHLMGTDYKGEPPHYDVDAGRPDHDGVSG